MTFRIILCIENPVGGEEQYSSGMIEIKNLEEVICSAQGQVVKLINDHRLIFESTLKKEECEKNEVGK